MGVVGLAFSTDEVSPLSTPLPAPMMSMSQQQQQQQPKAHFVVLSRAGPVPTTHLPSPSTSAGPESAVLIHTKSSSSVSSSSHNSHGYAYAQSAPGHSSASGGGRPTSTQSRGGRFVVVSRRTSHTPAEAAASEYGHGSSSSHASYYTSGIDEEINRPPVPPLPVSLALAHSSYSTVDTPRSSTSTTSSFAVSLSSAGSSIIAVPPPSPTRNHRLPTAGSDLRGGSMSDSMKMGMDSQTSLASTFRASTSTSAPALKARRSVSSPMALGGQ